MCVPIIILCCLLRTVARVFAPLVVIHGYQLGIELVIGAVNTEGDIFVNTEGDIHPLSTAPNNLGA